jgi:NAD(P)-dependent dehydrogenase (short-subunit alcohol dehydrogenase family)
VAEGQSVSIHQGSVGNPDDCSRVVDEVIEEFGRVDYLVNNAGVTVDKTVRRMTVEDWHAVLRVNLSGAFYMTKVRHPRSGHAGGDRENPRRSAGAGDRGSSGSAFSARRRRRLHHRFSARRQWRIGHVTSHREEVVTGCSAGVGVKPDGDWVSDRDLARLDLH